MIYNLLSGYIAGAIGVFCVLPIDIIKTRIQSSIIKLNSINLIKEIYINHGIRGFYKGGIIQILFVAPEKAIKFTTNDFVLKYTNNNLVAAGMCAGLSQVIITNPMEILKIHMQMNNNKNNYQNILKNIGIFNLYKGVSLCILRDVPFSAIYFPTYSILNNYIPNYSASLISGIIAAVSVTPMDFIKTQVQYRIKTNITQIIKEIINTNNYQILFRGCLLRALKSGPQFMITQTIYNKLK